MFLPVEDEVGEVVSKLVDESNPFYDMIIDIMHTFNNLDDKGQEIICNFTSDLVDRMAKGINKTINFTLKIGGYYGNNYFFQSRYWFYIC